MSLERPATTAATAVLLVAAVFPFVVLFPDPPAFGPASLALAATFGNARRYRLDGSASTSARMRL